MSSDIETLIDGFSQAWGDFNTFLSTLSISVFNVLLICLGLLIVGGLIYAVIRVAIFLYEVYESRKEGSGLK